MSTLDTAQLTDSFADEVVTHALVRDVTLPGGAGVLALITLDNGHDHTRPSTFGPRTMLELGERLDTLAQRAEAGEIVAVGVTGKPFVFGVGADLSGVPKVTRHEDARSIAALGHQVYSRLADLPVPSFAFVNGAVMGGGLELALACTYRSVSASVPAVAFPETFLGLVPGWGGCWLTPHLIGIEAAVKVIIENPLNQNRMLTGPKAAALGLFDVVLEPADFLVESVRWAARVLAGETVPRIEVDRDEKHWEAALAQGRALVQAKTAGAAPGPLRALDLLAAARTASRDEGFAAEDEALAELLMSDELRAGLYAFDLVQKRAKRPAGAPDRSAARKVTKVGVVGAGLMAGQLALLFARRLEVPVVLTDLDQTRVDKGVGYVRSEIDKLAQKGRLSPDAANRLRALVTGSTDKSEFADADFVIEAVFEELHVKKQVFAEVEAVVSPKCVLASNTSSLSITRMAADLVHPERVVGFHFFNPVAVMPLLEIVKGERTDDATLATAFATGKSLRKTSILVKDSPSFVVNRLLGRFMSDVSQAVDAGTPLEVVESAFDGIAPMSPFVLIELVGPAIALHNTETLAAAFPDRIAVSPGLRRFVESGKRGVYLHEGGHSRIDPEVAQMFGSGAQAAPLTAAQIREQVLSGLADEAHRMLAEGVVAAAMDVDLAMITGAGFAFWNGGLTPLLDRSGVSQQATGGRFLPPGVADAPR